jgi:hypothetical protein
MKQTIGMPTTEEEAGEVARRIEGKLSLSLQEGHW